MKKLLFVALIGTFVACGEAPETVAVVDSAAAAVVDSAAAAVDSTVKAQ